jgi:hypothetical protein
MQTASPYSDWMAFAIEGNVRFIVPSYDAAPALRSFDLYNPQPPFSSQVAELANYTLATKAAVSTSASCGFAC